MTDQKGFSFQVLKRQVSIEHVLTAYGLASSLKVQGDQLTGACPLHGGKNPTSFRVHLGRGIWHCFSGCGGGDVVELIRRIEDCDYAEAARHLHRISRCHNPVSPATERPHRPIADSRKFRPFRYRIPLQPRTSFLQKKKCIHVSTATRFEAGCTQRSTFLRDTVAVRLHDIDGQPLGYCGRRLLPEHIARFGKWRFPAAFPKSEILYNAHRAIHARAHGVVVVECPWAVIRLAQAGIVGAVALLGTTLSDIQARWLGEASGVLLMLDGDEAGRKAIPVIAEKLSGATTVFVHQLPDGHEPEDLSDHQLSAVVRDHLSSLVNQFPRSGLFHSSGAGGA